jgi:Flp pilus assembly protein TadD
MAKRKKVRPAASPETRAIARRFLEAAGVLAPGSDAQRESEEFATGSLAAADAAPGSPETGSYATDNLATGTHLVPLLHKLAREAKPGGEEYLYAHRQLAELVAERNPWGACLHARRVLRWLPEDGRAWGALAVGLTMLGHFRFAVRAYSDALAACPDDPWYAHNLGHLLDVALGKPADAIPYLSRARAAAPQSADVAASFVHALARCGRLAEAEAVVVDELGKRPTEEFTVLAQWIRGGAKAVPTNSRSEPRRAMQPRSHSAERLTRCTPPERFGGTNRTDGLGPSLPRLFAERLAGGLRTLPLSKEQRLRAYAIAREAFARGVWDGSMLRRAPATLAAAATYAVLFVDGGSGVADGTGNSPGGLRARTTAGATSQLSLGDVSASYRAPQKSMRAAFHDLRLRLALVPGDPRWSTTAAR